VNPFEQPPVRVLAFFLEPLEMPPTQTKRRTGFEPATSCLGSARPYLGYGLQITHIQPLA
jgi:hypothetical protein